MDMTLEWAEFVSYWTNWALVGALVVGVLATYGIVVALVVGVLATYGIVVAGNVKETFLKRDIAEANERAGVARQKANESDLRLIEYRKTRREKLAEPGHAISFVESIKPFAGTRFDVGHGPEGAREQWDFLWDLEPLFDKAGWVHIDWLGGRMFKKNNWPGAHWYGLSNVIGVSIEVSADSRQELLPAAKALADTLNNIGIAASVEDPNVSSTSANVDTIHFMVGEKR